jgi:hypothetical protein
MTEPATSFGAVRGFDRRPVVVGRIAQVIAALLASVELRCLVGCARHAHVPGAMPASPVTFWTMAALAMGACLLLRRRCSGIGLAAAHRSGCLSHVGRPPGDGSTSSREPGARENELRLRSKES